MTKTEFIEMIVGNHKSKQWVNGTFPVEASDGNVVMVSVKAYGKWVQRMDALRLPYRSIPEVKTVKAFRQTVTAAVEYYTGGVK